jgi:hypothetical protein
LWEPQIQQNILYSRIWRRESRYISTDVSVKRVAYILRAANIETLMHFILSSGICDVLFVMT